MNRKTIIVCFLVGIVAVLGIRATFMHELVINDESQIITVRTFETDLNKILSNASIVLRDEDVVTPERNTEIKADTQVTITRAKPVKIVEGDSIKEVYATQTNVANILENSNITLGTYDKVYPRKDATIALDRTIEIVRVDVSYITAEETIPYSTVYQMTDSLEAGEVSLVSSGSDGLMECTYKVVSENGIEISRQVQEEKIINEPVTEVVNEGADRYLVTSRGLPFKYNKVIVLKSTAYDLSYESCGKYPGDPAYGITYSGTHARPGVVAVDPKVISLGSKLYVESLDTSKDYGFASAEDTGSAIKGNRIDLFIENRRQALNYGVRYVKVYVLDEAFDDSLMIGYSQ